MSKLDAEKIRDLLRSRTPLQMTDEALSRNPWFFDQSGVSFKEWLHSALEELELPPGSQLFLLGSGNWGFSLSPENPGRPFKEISLNSSPSDLDFAIVSPEFFEDCWNDMVTHDHQSGAKQDRNRARSQVYWGRIQDKALLRGTRSRLRKMSDALARNDVCRRYPISIRIYRREFDLRGYITWSISALRRELKP